MRMRRRSFRRRGAPLKRKQPLWLATSYDIPVNSAVLPGNTYVELLEILGYEDYTDVIDGVFRRKSSGSHIRTIGRVSNDTVVQAPGVNGVTWNAAVIQMSQEALENTFAQDPADLVIHDPTTFAENVTRLNVLQMKFTAGYTAAFIANPGGLPTAFYALFNGVQAAEPESVVWRFDLNVKRKLHTDESLWMLVTGNVIQNNEPGAFISAEFRTLFYDND